MSTALNILTSARYDLRDTDSTEYENAELLDYLNRCVAVLDSTLGSFGSDWVLSSDTETLTTGDTSLELPSDFSTIRANDSVFIGTDDLSKDDPKELLYQQTQLDAGQPNFFALQGLNMIFERAADTDYSVFMIYNSKTETLEESDTMPYNGEFDQHLRQATVFMAKNRNEYDVIGDAAMIDFFTSAINSKLVSRKHTKKTRLNF